MKPDFALSLSQQGVRLFHRAATDWEEVGHVPVDSDDLAGDMEALRAAALALQGGEGRLDCKIVMPNDLVRYLAIDNPRAGEDEVLAALDGATPYALAELVHDYRSGGGRMHVAAVARASLEEAEVFTTEYGFTPLAFVATPEPWTFPGEVNFGPTRLAAALLPGGEVIEPDAEGVPVTTPPPGTGMAAEPIATLQGSMAADGDDAVPDGTGPDDAAMAPPAEAADMSDELSPEEAAPTDPAPDTDTPDDVAKAGALTGEPAPDEAITPSPGAEATGPRPASDEDMPQEVAPPGVPPVQVPDTAADDSAEAPFIAVDESGELIGPDNVPPAAATASQGDSDAGPEPAPVFASRSRPQGGGAVLPPVPPPVLPPVQPSVMPALESGKAGAEPVFASRTLRAATKAPEPGTRREPVIAATPGRTAAEATSTPPVIPIAPPPAPDATGRVVPLSAPSRPVPLPQPKARPGSGKAPEEAPPSMPGQHAARGAVPDGAPSPGPRKRRIGMGLMLTLLLIAVLAAVALWSTTLDGGLARLFGPESPRVATAPPTDTTPAVPITAAGEAEPVTTSGLAAGPEAVSLAPEFADGPEPDADPAALPGSDATAQGTAAPGLDTPEDEASSASALPEGATEPDTATLANRNAPPDGPETDGNDALAAAVVPGALVTPDEADRIYQATGVWLRAPRLPLLPRAVELDDLALSEADPARNMAVPVALDDTPGLAPDASILPQPVPPPAGTTITRDSRGLISATPEGVLLPTGITVFAGTPPRSPPTRPGTEPPPVDVEDVIAESGLRPLVRPDTVTEAAVEAGAIEAPQAEDAATTAPEEVADEEAEPGSSAAEDSAAAEATPGGVALALVAPDLRPLARPESVAPLPAWEGKSPPNRPAAFASRIAPEEAAPEEPADPLAATLEAIASAPDPFEGVTARAVPRALRPGARPNNFTRVVETQTEILARASTAVTERPAAPEPAPVPAPEPAPVQETAAAAPAAASGGLTREEAAEASSEVSSVAAPAAGPTPGGVASAATVARAINLREVNLIGVFGPQSSRRALVRLANGRMVRVGVGDSLDGGQVVAIGDGFLNYAKRGQTYSLHVPG